MLFDNFICFVHKLTYLHLKLCINPLYLHVFMNRPRLNSLYTEIKQQSLFFPNQVYLREANNYYCLHFMHTSALHFFSKQIYDENFLWKIYFHLILFHTFLRSSLFMILLIIYFCLAYLKLNFEAMYFILK